VGTSSYGHRIKVNSQEQNVQNSLFPHCKTLLGNKSGSTEDQL